MLSNKQFRAKINKLKQAKKNKVPIVRLEVSAKETVIYALVHPDDNSIYIGRTTNKKRRYKEHCRRQRPYPKDRWVRSLLERGKRPHMITLEVMSSELAYEAEEFYIEYFRFIGADVLNDTQPRWLWLMSNATKEKPKAFLCGC